MAGGLGGPSSIDEGDRLVLAQPVAAGGAVLMIWLLDHRRAILDAVAGYREG
jgi:hypothetical protein